MEMLSTKQKTVIIIAGVIVVGIFIYYMTTKANNSDYSAINEIAVSAPQEEEHDKNEEKEEETPKEIIIHITGAVENEGIVRLKEGSRIIDAIEAAGGLTSEVNLKKVNLAYTVQDGQKIYIPKTSDIDAEIGIDAKTGEAVIVYNGTEEGTTGKININTATLNELLSLSGVGESTAEKIIEYRKENGRFKTIEEIKNVSGIGNLKYESIKDYICVQ